MLGFAKTGPIPEVNDPRVQGGTLMRSHSRGSISRTLWCGTLFLLVGLAGSSAQADAIYSITDLGTLPGQTSSVATAINNQGQVVGISYNSADGYFGTVPSPPTAAPPTFNTSGSGAQSFLYSNGQISQISPTGGLATSINSEGQVVGGKNSSINDSGQYVTGPLSGINTGNVDGTSQLVSGGTTTSLPPLFNPYSINNSGQIAGLLVVNEAGATAFHPALYQNGQVTDLFSKVGSGEYYDSRAIAINQRGDVIITVQPFSGPNGSTADPMSSYLYNATTGHVTNLTALPGGSGMIAAALNDKDQAVANGFLFSNGTLQTLASLLPVNSGWSNLTATGINDAGQIVGQGLINGQEQAFLMTPIAEEVPEPAAPVSLVRRRSHGTSLHCRAARAGAGSASVVPVVELLRHQPLATNLPAAAGLVLGVHLNSVASRRPSPPTLPSPTAWGGDRIRDSGTLWMAHSRNRNLDQTPDHSGGGNPNFLPAQGDPTQKRRWMNGRE